jgi:SAM-dependent methyltransferase
MPSNQVSSVRARVGSGPAPPSPHRLAFIRRPLRRLVLRLIKPYTVHQQAVDDQLLDVLDGITERFNALEQRLTGLETTTSDMSAAHAAQQPIVDAAHGMLSGLRGTPYMWEMPISSFEQQHAGRVYGFREEHGGCPPQDLYRRLEDVFRGPHEWVADRQRPYRKLIGGRSPVIEMGCGRGTFLDALRDLGVDYVGVEPDRGMLEACRARGHTSLVETDANSYLQTLDDDTVGVVFSTQVIEHMPAGYLFTFLRLCLAKLQPGGILVAETPNPHSVHSSKTFWMDLTHEYPIFPELALSLCWLTGYESAYIFHPAGSGDADADRFAEPEFAVVAAKGEEAGAAPGS